MTRFDIHVNLGSFPCSKRGKSPRYISPQEMAEFFLSQGITHSLVLYNRDEYELLRELISLTDTKVYGVQCIMGTKESPTDITKPFNFDIGKEGVVGIKLASERGWWTDGKEVWSGADYTDKYHKKIFDSLPKNTIISVHTQGTSRMDNVARPMFFLNYSFKYPHLKWVMNHGGEYGPAITTARPSSERIRSGEGKVNLARHISHRMNVISGLHCAEVCHNVFIDSSCYSVVKGHLYQDFTQWCVGSDYPFSENFGIDYVSERKRFEKSCNINDQGGIDFFEKDVDELFENNVQHTNQLIEDYNNRENKKPNISDSEERMLIGRVDHLIDDILIDYYEEYQEPKYKQQFKKLLIESIKQL